MNNYIPCSKPLLSKCPLFLPFGQWQKNVWIVQDNETFCDQYIVGQVFDFQSF